MSFMRTFPLTIVKFYIYIKCQQSCNQTTTDSNYALDSNTNDEKSVRVRAFNIEICMWSLH